MTTEEARFPFKIEEMPTVGNFLHEVFVRDRAEVSADYPDYDDAYQTDFENKLELVEELIFPKEFTQKLKKATDDLVKAMKSLRPALDKLEGYVVRAKNMSVSAKDFGISAVRKKISTDDQEGLDAALKILIDNLQDATNNAALTAIGMQADFVEIFSDLKQAIKNGNALQNKIVSDRNKKVADNISVINALWDKMSDIAKGFKAFYKSRNSVKVDDYTWAKYKAKIRHTRKSSNEETPAV